MKRNYFATILFCFCLLISNAKAAVPSDISLQLHVANPDGTPITGNIALTVRLFDGQLSNNALYENDIADRYVSVTEGFVNYYIKNVYGLDFSKEIWAEIAIDGNVMPERIRFSAVPHSFFANRAHTADSVDTANVARAVLDNSITSEKITNATITNADIAQNTITPGNINTASAFDWTAQHSFKSNNNEITLNSTNYALQITKGTAKLLRLEGNNIVASYILTDTFEAKVFKTAAVHTDTLRIGNYIVYKTGDALTIKDAATGSNGITLNGQALGYLTSPTFATDDKNAIINKEYVDSTQNNILATIAELSGTLNNSLTPLSRQIDTVKSDLANLDSDVTGLTNGLSTNRLAKWNGNRFVNSNITEQGSLAVYSNTGVAFATKDSLALINKRYVDYTVDSAIKHVNGGMFEGLSHNTLPMWNATSNIFVNSKISESIDTVRIGGARFTMEGSPQTTSIRDVNHLYSNSLWTNNIVAKGIATDVAEYTAIDPITKLPGSADSTTLVPVAYVTKVADSLVNRIEADSVDGARLKYATVSDSKIIDLSGNKIKPGTVAGGYDGQLANNTIIDDNLRAGSVRDSHIVSGAVYSRHIANGSIEAEDIKDGTVDANKIATESVDSTHLKNAGISTADLANGAVTNDKVASIKGDKIEVNTMPGNRISDNSINGDKIQTEVIVNGHLANGAVTGEKINAKNIEYKGNGATSNYMPIDVSDSTLTTKKFVEEAIADVTSGGIANGSVTTDKLGDGAVNSLKIADNTVESVDIKDNTITTDDIKDNTILAIDLADNAVERRHINTKNIEYKGNGATSNYMPIDVSDSTLVTKKWVEEAITAVSSGSIADDAITTDHILNGEVKSADIADGAIQTQHLGAINGMAYTGNAEMDYYMPNWADSTLATYKLVNDHDDMILDIIDGVGLRIDDLEDDIEDLQNSDGLSPNSVETGHIKDGEVKSVDIADGAIQTQHLGAINSMAYTGNLATNDHMPSSFNDSVLTTYGLVNARDEYIMTFVDDAILRIDDLEDDIEDLQNSGGLSPNSVETGHIKDGTIKNEDIAADAAIAGSKIASATITSAQLANGAVTSGKILNGTIKNEDIAADAAIAGSKVADATITGTQIAATTIVEGNIATDAVTTAKIKDAAVTDAKLSVGNIQYNNAAGTNNDYMPSTSADATLTTKKYVDDKVANASGGTIAAGAITTTEIANGTIKNEDIAADAAIAGSKVADATITSTQIAATTIAEGNIATDAITSGKIADGTITSSDIGTGAVAEANIATDAVTTAKIKDAAVTDAKLSVGNIQYNNAAGTNNDYMPSTSADATLTTKKYVDDKVANASGGTIAAGAITTTEIANGTIKDEDIASDAAIAGSKIADATITSTQIAATTIAEGNIAANAITSGKIADGTITSSDIGTGAVAEANIATDAVTTAKIKDAAVTDAKLKVSNIAYEGNSSTSNGAFLSNQYGDSTLATVAFVLLESMYRDMLPRDIKASAVDGFIDIYGSNIDNFSSSYITTATSQYTSTAALSVMNDMGGPAISALSNVSIKYPSTTLEPGATSGNATTAALSVSHTIAGGTALKVEEGVSELLNTTITSADASKDALVVSNTATGGTALKVEEGVSELLNTTITSDDASKDALVVSNTATGGIALKVESGSVVLPHVETNLLTTQSASGWPAGVVYNLPTLSSPPADHLPMTIKLPTPTAPGAVIYLFNGTGKTFNVSNPSTPNVKITVNATDFVVPKDEITMFIAVNASGTAVWKPVK